MKRYFLVFFALAFTLTSSASAAMMCCWNATDTTQEQSFDVPPPCHEANEKADDIDISPSSACCEDMSFCNTPLVFGANATTLQYDNTAQPIELAASNILISNSSIPPTPPPKLFL